MAWCLPCSLPSLTSPFTVSKITNIYWCIAGARSKPGNLRLRNSLVAKATEANPEGQDEDDKPAFNLFGFVTNNPSSRSAIQLPESPQRMAMSDRCYIIEDKGKEYGKYVRSGELVWFVRETGSPDSRRGTVLFLHGASTQSFSYRVVMSLLSNTGFHCIAPDWIGFGFSDKPQPGYGFDYTEKEFHEALDKLLFTLDVKSPFFLVVQGFLVGSYGLTWALKNTSMISKLVILNSPLTSSSPIPGLFNQLRIPLYGEFTCQNAIVPERFIEGGSLYYPLPFIPPIELCLEHPGRALLEAARKINFRDTLTRISDGFSSQRWDKPILLAWGIADKYLPQSIAEDFQKGNPGSVKVKLIDGAGHMPQEDWPEKVIDALRVFF